jgi:hypothetical protein
MTPYLALLAWLSGDPTIPPPAAPVARLQTGGGPAAPGATDPRRPYLEAGHPAPPMAPAAPTSTPTGKGHHKPAAAPAAPRHHHK